MTVTPPLSVTLVAVPLGNGNGRGRGSGRGGDGDDPHRVNARANGPAAALGHARADPLVAPRRRLAVFHILRACPFSLACTRMMCAVPRRIVGYLSPSDSRALTRHPHSHTDAGFRFPHGIGFFRGGRNLRGQKSPFAASPKEDSPPPSAFLQKGPLDGARQQPCPSLARARRTTMTSCGQSTTSRSTPPTSPRCTRRRRAR